MRVERSCLAGSPYAIAYGWLRAAADRVLATNERGKSEPFRHVALPGSLRAGGALVYRLLEGTATTILTETPRGHVLSREPYGARIAQSTARDEQGSAGAAARTNVPPVERVLPSNLLNI